MPNLITVRDTAALLGVTRPTVWRMLERGDLSGYRYPSGTIRLDENEVKAWMQQRRTDHQLQGTLQ